MRPTPAVSLKQYGIWFAVVSVLGMLFFAYLFYSETGHFPAVAKELEYILVSIAVANVCGWLVFVIDAQLDRLVTWRKHFFPRFAIGFVANVTVMSLLISAIGYAIVKYTYAVDTEVFYLQWHEEIWKLGILILLTIFIYEVFYGWFYSYRYFANIQVDQLKSERWQMELQFESLKSQISPHYLFNCLNTISSLLYKDSEMAEEFIRRMADTFRYVMRNQKNKLVTLREEIEFVKAYYYLLQVRYHHDLKLDINIPSRLLDTFVPPLAIQMLIENAVKHNEISKKYPLFIYISAQDNTFINVSSTKTVASNSSQSFQVGLNNIRNRYRFFTADKIVIKDTDKYVVQLPVIKGNALAEAPSPRLAATA